ncbi:MAG: F0F1 ATP synthase subunit B [Clostridiales bacterium]|nr:F0F1 ATP synthase subunit B [Clostridiales bacterium]
MKLDYVSIIAYILNVVVLFFFLRWLLYKPVKKFIDARSAAFDERVENLAKQETDIAQQKKKYDDFIADSQKEANKVIQQSRENAKKRAETIIDEAKQSAKDLISHTRDEIAEERDAAQARMREEVADIAVGIATRVLEREVTKEDNDHIIESFFKRERIG